MMMAVDDIATAPPTTTAAVGATPKSPAAASATIAVVTQHLRAADAEHVAAHGEQARQREFQPEREHEECDAEIGEQMRRIVVDDQRERVRAEQHADGEVAQDRRQGKLAHAGHDEDRGGQQDQNLQQRIRVHSRSI